RRRQAVHVHRRVGTNNPGEPRRSDLDIKAITLTLSIARRDRRPHLLDPTSNDVEECALHLRIRDRRIASRTSVSPAADRPDPPSGGAGLPSVRPAQVVHRPLNADHGVPKPLLEAGLPTPLV